MKRQQPSQIRLTKDDRRGTFRPSSIVNLPSVLLMAIIYLSTGVSLFAAGDGKDSAQIEHYSYTLKYISVEKGQEFVKETGIGTCSSIPGTSQLFITAPHQEMKKLRSILNLVDQQEKYVVHRLKLDADSISNLSLKIDNINFPGAMIDIRNDSVVIVSPLNSLDKILQTVQNSAKETALATKPMDDGRWKMEESSLISRPSPLMFEANMNQSTDTGRITQGNAEETSQQAMQRLLSSLQSAGTQAPKTNASDTTEPNIPNANDIVALNLPPKLTLAEFLEMVGPNLKMDFAYDSTQFVGDVTFSPNGKLKGSVTVGDLYSYLEDVLKIKGFAMTRSKGNLVWIVPIADVLKIDPAIVSSDKPKIQPGDIVITTYFELKYIDTASAEKLLSDMQLSTKITSIPERQTLIVTAYANRMQHIRQMLNIIDTPGMKRLRVRQLRYTIAQTIAPKLQNLAEQLGTASVTIATSAASSDETVSLPPQQANESLAAYTQRIAPVLAAQRQQSTLRAQAAAAAGQQQQQSATGQAVFLDSDERTNSIFMIGRPDQLDQLNQLIDTLDVAQQDLRTLKTYKMKYLDAAEIRNKLVDLGIISAAKTTGTSSSSAAPSGTSAKPGVTTPQPVIPSTVTNASGQTTETLAAEPQVILIEQTNSLLVRATPEQHERIAAIIQHIDNEVEQIPYQMYQLRNQDPNRVQEVLSKLIQETVRDPQSKIQTTVSKLEDQVTIVSDSTTSSLIVYANKKNQDWIGNLIAKLDKRRPQVLIDVTLVQISKNDAFNYDLNLLSSFPDLTSTSGLTTALMPGASNKNPVSTLTTSGRDRFIDLQSNGGQGTGFYGDKHINALLTAMQQKDYGRVMAKPKILVNDNEPGTISTTDSTYVTKTSSIPVTSGSAGTETSLIQTSTDYEKYDAGITLGITPHISESGLLRLDITLKRSDFGTITGVKPPDTSESNVKTVVTIPDGSTIILGGMQKLNQSKADTKIPFLGDIPLIGGLFRSINNNDAQRNLYVFVKAEIIKPPAEGTAVTELQTISDKEKTAFETHEDEFQKHQGWPGIAPEPVQPFRVLDAQ
jgi:general secretion pathway protein D